LRIIEDHAALVDDLVSTGEDLSDVCVNEDGQNVKQDMVDLSGRYNDVKYAMRNKLGHIDDLLHAIITDVCISCLICN